MSTYPLHSYLISSYLTEELLIYIKFLNFFYSLNFFSYICPFFPFIINLILSDNLILTIYFVFIFYILGVTVYSAVSANNNDSAGVIGKKCVLC